MLLVFLLYAVVSALCSTFPFAVGDISCYSVPSFTGELLLPFRSVLLHCVSILCVIFIIFTVNAIRCGYFIFMLGANFSMMMKLFGCICDLLSAD